MTTYEIVPSEFVEQHVPTTSGPSPLVSVIVPVYRGERFLAETLESALRQTYERIEVIVVDDGSPDASAEIVRAFPAVRYVRQKNAGVGAARNRGIEESRGSLLVFLDQDDVLFPWAIAAGVRSLADNPDCVFAFGRHVTMDVEGRPNWQEVSPVAVDGSYLAHLRGETLCPPSRAIFRKDAVEAIGGFTPELAPADDYDLHLQLSRTGRVATHGSLVVGYRAHGNNQSMKIQERMLTQTLAALERQRPHVAKDPEALAALETGRRHWQRLLGQWLPLALAQAVKRGSLSNSLRIARALLEHHPQALLAYAYDKATGRYAR